MNKWLSGRLGEWVAVVLWKKQDISLWDAFSA